MLATSKQGNVRPAWTIGIDGKRITRADLPPVDTKRWVARRKATVVKAVEGGLITLEEACRMYGLSEEEFSSWRDALSTHGVNALRTTALKRYR
jgi:hypothetical protein